MKTTLAIVLSFLVCVTMLSACQPSKPDPQSGNDTATTTTEAATTTTEATTTTTEAVTTTTQATTTTTEPTVEITMNTELLSCVGKTYSEITALYGELVEVSRNFEGGFCDFRFKNSSAYFGFGTETFWDQENNGQRPNADAPCVGIREVPVHEMFLGLTEPVTGEELADIYNVEYTGPGYSQMHSAYTCGFIYEELRFFVYTEADYIITPDATIPLIKPTAEW